MISNHLFFLISSQSLDLLALSFLNNLGDVLDLQHALDPSSFPNSEKDDPKSESKNRFYGLNNHCSALIKVSQTTT